MKRIFALALVILISFYGSGAFGQLISYHFDTDNEGITTNVPLNEISTRAFRNFVKTYGFVSEAIWRKAAHGYTVRWFGADSVEYMIHYTQRGSLSDTHIYYTCFNAPSDIRTLMTRLYPAYNLMFVNELEQVDHPLYEVGLTHNGLMMIVNVKDREVRAEENFTPARSK